MVGLKNTSTGDTLAIETAPIRLESMDFPEPVISVAIEPKTKGDQDKLGAGLQRLDRRGPDLPRPHGRRDGADAHLGHGRAPPRDHRRPPDARVQRRRERRPPAGRVPRDDLEARREDRGQVRPPDRRPRPVRPRRDQHGAGRAGRGLRVPRQDRRRQDPARVHLVRSTSASRRRWSRASSPATRSWTSASYLVDGSYHDVDSSEMAFKVAGSMAFKNAMQRAKPKLLEPVMAVEVVTPEEYLGDVMGDLNSRRGHIEHLEPRGQRAGDPRPRPARNHVWLRNRPALDDAGPGHVHHAIRSLRGSASVDRRRDRRRRNAT